MTSPLRFSPPRPGSPGAASRSGSKAISARARRASCARRSLGWQGAVKSPTFTLLETYPLEGFTLNHFDFYRFETPEEFDDAGFGEEFGPGRVCCTEWSGRAEPFLPPADLTLALAHEGAGRRAALSAASPLGEEILRTMTERSASWKQAAAV